MSAAPQESVPALALAAPHALAQPRLQPRPQPAPQSPAMVRHALGEPTFDELVTGAGRHRGSQLEATASLLRRLALRARLLPTPARRSTARPARVP